MGKVVMRSSFSAIPMNPRINPRILPTAAAAAMLLALGANSASAAVIAAWDTWADTTTAYDADILTTGFTATVDSGANRVNAGFGSSDGTFGTLSGAGSTLDGALLPRESDSATFTITLTNSTGSAYSIDSMHFDFEVRNDNGPDSFVVTYVSGGLGPASTQIGSVTGQTYNGYGSGLFDFTDYDYTLSSALTDTILANGESAIFTIVFSGAPSASNSSAFDNLAFQGSVIPEPSVALLGGLGILMLLRRRR